MGPWPECERQGAAKHAGVAACLGNFTAGVSGVAFESVDDSSVESAVGSPEFRRLGTV